MAKRILGILRASDYLEITRLARARQITPSEWARQAIIQALNSEITAVTTRKREALRAATKYDFPPADIAQMLAEIEQGYLSGHKLSS